MVHQFHQKCLTMYNSSEEKMNEDLEFLRVTDWFENIIFLNTCKKNPQIKTREHYQNRN